MGLGVWGPRTPAGCEIVNSALSGRLAVVLSLLLLCWFPCNLGRRGQTASKDRDRRTAWAPRRFPEERGVAAREGLTWGRSCNGQGEQRLAAEVAQSSQTGAPGRGCLRARGPCRADRQGGLGALGAVAGQGGQQPSKRGANRLSQTGQLAARVRRHGCHKRQQTTLAPRRERGPAESVCSCRRGAAGLAEAVTSPPRFCLGARGPGLRPAVHREGPSPDRASSSCSYLAANLPLRRDPLVGPQKPQAGVKWWTDGSPTKRQHLSYSTRDRATYPASTLARSSHRVRWGSVFRFSSVHG